VEIMTIADIMSVRPVAADVSATVGAALDVMRERGVSSVLVLPPPGSTEYGIVTKRDVIGKVVREGIDPGSIRLGDIMTWRLTSVQPSWTLERAAELMATANVRRLPVGQGGQIIGLVSDTDIFTALAPRHEWEHVRQVRKERALQRAARTGPARTVADLMSTPVLTTNPGASVRSAVQKMVSAGISSLLVTDEASPRGIITKRDVVTKAVARGRDSETMTVAEIMSRPVRTVDAGATLEQCSSLMAEAGMRRFPVARAGQIVGIVSDSDILAAVAGRRWLAARRGPTSLIAADVMRTPRADRQLVRADALPPELSVWECATRLAQAGVRELPVVQEGRIIGIVGEGEIVKALAERGGPD
jgi:signal-transduction protein with cAMP-binding, CBS, and nucleotidyltransferase domain